MTVRITVCLAFKAKNGQQVSSLHAYKETRINNEHISYNIRFATRRSFSSS